MSRRYRGPKLVLRRPEGVISASDGLTTRFDAVPMHADFYITPDPGKFRLCFIKTHATGAQVHNWDNDSTMMDQYFPPDFRVYKNSKGNT